MLFVNAYKLFNEGFIAIKYEFEAQVKYRSIPSTVY